MMTCPFFLHLYILLQSQSKPKSIYLLLRVRVWIIFPVKIFIIYPMIMDREGLKRPILKNDADDAVPETTKRRRNETEDERALHLRRQREIDRRRKNN